MGRCVIAAYTPKPGAEQALLEAVQKHLEVLRAESLVTERPAYVMRAANGTVVEVFEWRSAESIKQAHENPAVQSLWAEFGAICEYTRLARLPEAQDMFAEFDSVEF
ncbi:MAG: antibiotic biosynthesis monooxygenase [Gammaproteobacteria bacterium]